MFVTDADKPASTDINVYDEFVQAQAAGGHADNQDHASQFRALASTADDDARDNTETTYTATQPGVPIYVFSTVNKVADDYQDLHDGTWDEKFFSKDPHGETVKGRIWTGSNTDGTEYFDAGVSGALGTSSVRYGHISSSPTSPLSQGSASSTTSYRFYALPGVFVVEPNTAATADGSLSGKPRVGETLTATISNIVDPEISDIPNHNIRYIWSRDNGTTVTEIQNVRQTAKTASYTLTDADANRHIKVAISFEDDYSNKEGPFEPDATERVVPHEVLVRNIYSTPADPIKGPVGQSTPSYGQKFTTCGATNGYTIESIGWAFAILRPATNPGNQLTITINATDNGSPGDVICTLDNPATFRTSGLHTFTTNRCPVPQPNTDYFAVINRSNFSTSVPSETTTAASAQT